MENNLNGLVNYYLDKGYIGELDRIYCLNRLMDLVNLTQISTNEYRDDLYSLFDNVTNYALENQIIENNSFAIDYFNNQLTNIFIDKPSVVNKRIDEEGLDYLYNLNVDTNYIKLKDLEKNLKFSKYDISITINLAKPEKSLEEIAMLKTVKSTSYPKCLLCVENIGFSGNMLKASRINHRAYELKLNNREWLVQYSPYLYFNKHCILFDKIHQNMVVDDETVKIQADFVERYPDYFIGNNAELAIVGGSILDHNHFQGGVYEFDIDRCNVLDKFQRSSCDVEVLDWHLSAIRVSGKKEDVIKLCNTYKDAWFSYENLSLQIVNNVTRHNTVNFITRYIDNKLSVIIIFRNNYADDTCPTGLFHADPYFHHLKSENIGLIEAMGLAILPGRLLADIEQIKAKLKDASCSINPIHQTWYEELKIFKDSDLDALIQDSIAVKFKAILKCCNVFKFTNTDKMLSEIKNLVEE